MEYEPQRNNLVFYRFQDNLSNYRFFVADPAQGHEGGAIITKNIFGAN